MDRLATGFVRSPHGLNGFVKVESYSGEFSHFEDLDEVVLRTGGQGGIETLYTIEAVEGHSQCVLIKFKGIDTPEAAKKLAGSELVVSRDKACQLEEGEYYVTDLCQCTLVYKNTPLGTITSVMEGGANDLLEVTLFEGSVPELADSDTKTDKTVKSRKPSGKQVRLIPLRNEFVGRIDLKAQTIELMHRWILE